MRLGHAGAAIVALWSCELMLARVTGEPQSLIDILESGVGLGLLGLVPPILLLRLMSPGLARTIALCVAAAVPLALVCFGILIPVALQSMEVAAFCLVGLFTALAAWRILVFRIRGEPFPGPLSVAAVVALASLGVWWLKDGELPPWLLLGQLGLTLAAVGVFASRRRLLPWVGAVTVAVAWMPRLSVAPEWTNTRPPASGPDIVMLVVDTLRQDFGERMSAYQRIAAEGIAFRNALAASPWTTPSMGTLFTGRRPPEHGAQRMKNLRISGLSPETATLAERLRDSGYDTAAVVTSGRAGRRYGFDRGFASFSDEQMIWSIPRSRSASNARPVLARLLSVLGLQGRPASIDSNELSRRAASVFEHRRPDRPVFLWVHFLDSHLPYRHAEGSGLPWRQAVALDNAIAETVDSDVWRSEERMSAIRRAYEWEVQIVDDAIHSLLDALGEPPERGRVVVLVSDHGEEFMDHGGFLHGHSFYQEVIAIPLAISGLPGRPKGVEEFGVVGHIDVMPTLLAAAGVPMDGLSGQDLARPVEPRIYVSENLSKPAPDLQIAARHLDWKLVVGPGEAVRLHDLGSDSEESVNLADSHPEVLQRMRSGFSVDAVEPVAVDLSEEDQRMLEALGYGVQ